MDPNGAPAGGPPGAPPNRPPPRPEHETPEGYEPEFEPAVFSVEQQQARAARETAEILRHVHLMDRVYKWVLAHYGDYESNCELTCRALYFPKMARWTASPFSNTPVQVMRASGMKSAVDCPESIFRACVARPYEPPHHYAERLMIAARVQQLLYKYSYVTQLVACIKFITNVPNIMPGLSQRIFELLEQDFGMFKPYDIYLLADYAQRAYTELHVASLC
jgi:hypothetical protein